MPNPVLAPQLSSNLPAQSNAAIDCYMWQTFVYLTWGVQSGQRGVPNPSTPYGAKGQPTVWESFKTHDEIFLPGAAQPAPWNSSSAMSEAHKKLLKLGNANAAPTSLRVLKNTSKVFRADVANALHGLTTSASGDSQKRSLTSPPLSEIVQAGGGVLYDQAKNPVYYEMLLNETGFNYVVNNGLYNANTQYAFAQKNGLALPSGSVEIKAAWKVLTASEAQSGRFHTAQALLGTAPTPVTVGLVGLHIFQMPSANSFYQGFWATFAQVDNAPPLSGSKQASYSFNDPSCAPAVCPVNSKSGNPSQVVQVFGVAQEAAPINAYMSALIANTAPTAAWQYYQLLDVQWATSSTRIGQPGRLAPLPNGTPSTTTLMNPVLETYLQKSNVSCLGCHTNASVAMPSSVKSAQPFASSYSFLFGHAQQPAANKVNSKAASTVNTTKDTP